MNRSMMFLLSLGLGLVTTPALAQQPLQPAPVYPPNDSQYGSQPAQPQYDPAQQQQQYAQQPVDPYAAYGDSSVDDEEDDGYDVTYDISTSEDQQYDDGYDPNAYQQFESTLSPYGSWQDVPSYGHVWVPSSTVVGYDFSPYDSGGHWVMSDYGWTWASDWDWGWAPFHYGRWLVVGGYGWCWMPGTTWGPGWVDWRFGSGYVGWAPMGPRGVVIGPPRGVRSPWRFTTAAQLGVFHPRYLPSRAVAGVWGHTTPIHNTSQVSIGNTAVRFNAGPPAHLVAQAVGHPITPVSLHAVAPRALPNTRIQPRVGVPLQQRPWMQSRPIGGTFAHQVPGAHTLGQPSAAARPNVTIQGRAQPLGWRAPSTYSQQPYRAPYAQQPYHAPYAQQPYHAPAAMQPYHAPAAMQPYHAPAAMQPYHAAPAYRAPYAQQPYHYSAPQPYHYSAPPMQQHYAAPTYSAPHYSAPAQQHFSAPTYSAPTYSAPHYSAPAQQHFSAPAPAVHAGGGFGGGFHGGGRR